ncbi:STAS domain-containing protein [Sedimenticola selenatireducens]|nr:STAS domain-containing protein [Sedimenticola selenatireducens]
MNSSGQILHGSQDGVEILCYKGDIRHTLCVALDRYLQTLMDKKDLKGFVVDLTQAESVDSTNLGILARLARVMQKEGLPKVTLISDQPDINELLEAVGFDRVFDIVETREGALAKLSEIPVTTSGDVKTTQLLLEAHRALMALNEANRVQFQDVVKAFETALED